MGADPVGLHLALDRSASGAEVRAAHQRMGKPDPSWPLLPTPDRTGAIAVFHVAAAGAMVGSVAGHAEAVRRGPPPCGRPGPPSTLGSPCSPTASCGDRQRHRGGGVLRIRHAGLPPGWAIGSRPATRQRRGPDRGGRQINAKSSGPVVARVRPAVCQSNDGSGQGGLPVIGRVRPASRSAPPRSSTEFRRRHRRCRPRATPDAGRHAAAARWSPLRPTTRPSALAADPARVGRATIMRPPELGGVP